MQVVLPKVQDLLDALPRLRSGLENGAFGEESGIRKLMVRFVQEAGVASPRVLDRGSGTLRRSMQQLKTDKLIVVKQGEGEGL